MPAFSALSCSRTTDLPGSGILIADGQRVRIVLLQEREDLVERGVRGTPVVHDIEPVPISVSERERVHGRCGKVFIV